MLRKLIKYEFQATARYFVPLYLLLLLLALLTRLTMSVTIESNPVLKSYLVDIPAALLGFAYAVGLFSIGLVTLLLIVQRFYKNLLGREGYLMFTLPVTPVQLLWSKLLTALVWAAAGTAAVILSLFVLAADASVFSFLRLLFHSISVFFSENAPHSWIVAALLLAVLAAGALHAFLQVYAAITLGCQAKKYRILLGLGVYLGLSMAEQLLMSVALTTMALMPDFTFGLLYFFGFRETDAHTAIVVLEVFLGGLLVFSLVLGAVYYIVVRQLLRTRLNLE